MISIVTPAYNESDNLLMLCNELIAVLKPLKYDYEILVVENGSKDDSIKILEEIRNTNKRVKYLKLTRNFGHQGGILAGLEHAKGDVVITMDADLQHPPSLIPEMVKKWEEGYLIVNTKRRGLKSSTIRKIIDNAFYYLMDYLADLKIGQADFRLLDRIVLDRFNAFSEREKFIRGLISWTGYKGCEIVYDVRDRKYGTSKFSRKHLFDFAFQGITSFSIAPLRLLFQLGLIILIPSSIYLFIIVFMYTFYFFNVISVEVPPGWATTTVTITFFGAIQLLSLGILGEYIGRIFNEVKNRPNYIVEEENLENE